jgi:hypothetical protein
VEDIDVDGRIILKWIVQKWEWEARTALIWHRIGTGGGHL